MPNATRLILLCTCLLMAACLVPLYWLGADLIWPSFVNGALHTAAVFALLGVLSTLERAPLACLLLEVTAWSLLVTLLINLPTALLVRLPVPLMDQHALALDARMGLKVSDWVHFSGRHPACGKALGFIYNTLHQADVIGLYLPILCRRARWSSEMFVALCLSLAFTWVIVSVAQGIGPWVVNGVTPARNRRHWARACSVTRARRTFTWRRARSTTS